MKITDLLHEETMELQLEATTKEGVIDEMIDLLDRFGTVKSKRKLKKAIMDREKLSTTGVGSGIAIPHAKTKAVTKPCIVFGRSEKGIPFESLDGNPVFYLFMITTTEDGNNLHLEALSKLARLLMHEEFKEGLKEAKTAQEVLTLINEFNQEG